jgi:hypothetical protein
MAVNNVVSERRAERKAAAEAKREANWQKRYDKAPAKRQERMDTAKSRKTERIAKRDARKAERLERRATRKEDTAGMKEKRNLTSYTDDDRMFFLQNAKQRNMTLKAYYAKYVK